MQAFTGMITHRAKTAKESRRLIAEMEQRAKRIEEVTGKPIEIRHAMSMLQGVVNWETMKHTNQYIKDGSDFSDYTLLRAKILQSVNVVDCGSMIEGLSRLSEEDKEE